MDGGPTRQREPTSIKLPTMLPGDRKLERENTQASGIERAAAAATGKDYCTGYKSAIRQRIMTPALHRSTLLFCNGALYLGTQKCDWLDPSAISVFTLISSDLQVEPQRLSSPCLRRSLIPQSCHPLPQGRKERGAQSKVTFSLPRSHRKVWNTHSHTSKKLL